MRTGRGSWQCSCQRVPPTCTSSCCAMRALSSGQHTALRPYQVTRRGAPGSCFTAEGSELQPAAAGLFTMCSYCMAEMQHVPSAQTTTRLQQHAHPAHAAGKSTVQAGPIKTLPPVHKAVHNTVSYACLPVQLLTWTGTSPQLGPSSMA